jgi:cytochrome b561
VDLSASDRPYTATARLLHWLVVLLMTAQFVVGYSMDADGRGRGRGRGSGSGHGRGRGGDFDLADNRLLRVHVALGLTILVLTVVRVWWRRRAGLPPWAPSLSRGERTLAHYTERALLTLSFVIPLTGLWLVLVNDDALGVHVTAHIAFFVAIASHIGLVLRRGLLHRML